MVNWFHTDDSLSEEKRAEIKNKNSMFADILAALPSLGSNRKQIILKQQVRDEVEKLRENVRDLALICIKQKRINELDMEIFALQKETLEQRNTTHKQRIETCQKEKEEIDKMSFDEDKYFKYSREELSAEYENLNVECKELISTREKIEQLYGELAELANHVRESFVTEASKLKP